MSRPRDCRYEADVLELAASHLWPARAPAGLRAHVATCATCADLVVITSAFACDDEMAAGRASVPDAALVWHQAARRARVEAARRAARPVLVAQTVTLLVVAALLVAWAGGLLEVLARAVPGASAIVVAWMAAIPSALAGVSTTVSGWVSSLSPTYRWTLAGAVAGPFLLVLAAALVTRLADSSSEPQSR